MKKIALSIVLALSAIVASAFSYEYEGSELFYTVTGDNECSVSKAGTLAENVKIPETVTYEDKTYKVIELGVHAFSNCTGLKSIDIPSSVTSIGSHAFAYCTGLKSIDIPSSVTSIGLQAFADSGLTSIDIPSSITSIDSYAFAYCPSLSNIYIPSSVTTIESYAFAYCPSLSNIYIPSSVTTIESFAFYECTGIENLRFADADEAINIGSWSFGSCPIKTIYIGRNWNGRCSNSVENVSLGLKVTELPDYAFRGCANLKNINIPNTVPKIGDRVFSGCTSLESIDIPNSVTSIGLYAFEGCSSLTQYYSYSQIPPQCGNQALDDIDKSLCTLYVPAKCREAYACAEQWMEFIHIEEMDSVGGVDDVVLSDGSEAQIDVYNVSGIFMGHSLKNLAKGVYFVRQGGKTQKVFVE